jgi:DNA polymerase-4
MLIYDRHIAHLDIDDFFIAVERLRNSRLIGKPVLIGGEGDRGIVAACSGEAAAYGVHAGLPMRVALRLCKSSVIVRGDFEEYSKQSKIVTDVITDSVPLVEKAAIDQFYVDLTGMDKFFGCAQFTAELKLRVLRESGLISTYGLASNKMVSKVAAIQGMPNGQLEIPFGNEKGFLGPLSVMKIPGVGKETGFKLIKMGVETIKVLSEIPAENLCDVVGAGGNELWRRANGIDESLVIPYSEQKSLSKEFTFQQDTIDMNLLLAQLARMTESLAFELRKENRLTGCIKVKIRYSDGDTHATDRKILYNNADHVLIAVVREVFRKLFTRRMLVRLVGLRFQHLIPGVKQIDMFNDSVEMIRLYKAVDSVKKRFGESKLLRCSSTILK